MGGRRWTRGSLVVLVAAATLFGTTGCEPTCGPPYVPVLAEEMYSTVPVPPSPNWPAGGTARPAPVPGFDTDGDGRGDTVGGSEDRLGLVVHRGSGDLTLVVAPPALVADPSADSVRAGDLDSDGRDDLVVTTSDPSAPGPDGTPRMTTSLVSGTTPDGVHDLADVGTRPFGAEPLGSTQGVGDLDADGYDDLVRRVPASDTGAPAETRVWFGADLDLTPGDTSPVAPSRILVGALGNTLALDGGRTALGLLSPVGAGDAVTWELTVWLPEGELRFAFPGSWPPYFKVEVVDASDTTYLRVTWEYGRVASRWAWDLHDLCAGAPPAAA